MSAPFSALVQERRFVRDDVFDALVDAIVLGQLRPGEHLRDTEIESWIGASRSPVRDALNRLAGIGLIEILPQRFTRVAPIDVKYVRHVCDVLSAIYSYVIHEVTPLLEADDLAVLTDYRAQVLVSRTHSLEAIRAGRTLNDLFGLYIRAYGNTFFAKIHQNMSPHVVRALNLGNSSIPLEEGHAVLRSMIQATEQNDADQARDIASKYFSQVTPLLTSALSTLSPDEVI